MIATWSKSRRTGSQRSHFFEFMRRCGSTPPDVDAFQQWRYDEIGLGCVQSPGKTSCQFPAKVLPMC